MKHLKSLALIAGVLSLSSCSTSPFSCNQTAVDSCLTIEEVNAMTEQGVYLKEGGNLRTVAHAIGQKGREGKQSLAQGQHTPNVWFAPGTSRARGK
jgi:hypothetical protein